MSNKNINKKQESSLVTRPKTIKSYVLFFFVVFLSISVSAIEFYSGNNLTTSISNTTMVFLDYAVAENFVVIGDTYIYFPTLTYTNDSILMQCIDLNLTGENINYYLTTLNCSEYIPQNQSSSIMRSTDSFFFIDITARHNLYAIIIFFIVAIGLMFFKQQTFSAVMFIVGGFILLFSGIHIIISLVPLLAGIIIGGSR